MVRHPQLAEDPVGLALGVEVRHLVLAHQRRHPVVLERNPLPGVLQGGPDHVLQSGILGGLGLVSGLDELAFRREVLPEVGETKGAVSAGKGAANARRIVGIAGNDVGPGVLESLSLLRFRLAGDGADSESAIPVGQDSASQSPALRTGGPDNGNDLFLGHDESPK